MPFLNQNRKMLSKFLVLLADIYESTDDEELLNIISVEIFESANEYGYVNEVLKLQQRKIVEDFRKRLG